MKMNGGNKGKRNKEVEEDVHCALPTNSKCK